MISIVDYGMGNIRSVEKALEKLGFETRLIETHREDEMADKLVLPGVGAFGDAMKGLREHGLVEPIREYAKSGRVLFGICLGMQVFFESSDEDPGVEGLGLIPGEVKRFQCEGLKIPHMGWNNLDVTPASRLLAGIGDTPYVYFVHSYYVAPRTAESVAATCDYGGEFTAAVEIGNVCGTQFHPEKSQAVGMHILKNFGGM